MLRRFLTACFLVWMAGAAMAGPFEDGFARHGPPLRQRVPICIHGLEKSLAEHHLIAPESVR